MLKSSPFRFVGPCLEIPKNYTSFSWSIYYTPFSTRSICIHTRRTRTLPSLYTPPTTGSTQPCATPSQLKLSRLVFPTYCSLHSHTSTISKSKSSSMYSNPTAQMIKDKSKHHDLSLSMLSDKILLQRMFKKCSRFETRSMYQYLKEVLARSIPLDAKEWVMLLNAYRHRVTTKGDVGEMCTILQHLKKTYGSVPLPALEVTLVRAAQCEMLDLVELLLEDIQKINSEFSVPVIGAVLNLHYKMKNPEKALTFYKNLPPTFVPTTSLHTILMKIYAALGDVEMSEDLFQDILYSVPDNKTLASAYAWMAQIYAQKKEWDKAKIVAQYIKQKKIQRVPLTYHVFVELALFDKNWTEALDLCYECMKVAKKPHFSYMLKNVLECMLNLTPPELSKAEELMETYKATCRRFQGKSPAPYYPYAPLLNYYVKNTPEKAKLFFESILGAPYLHDYTVIMMMRIYMQHERWNEAEAFLNECFQRGYQPGPNAPTLKNWRTLPILNEVQGDNLSLLDDGA
ncbi:hypothetical protein HMI56_001399 [Coelomomyces lativittatus]|nr:hypothetical protein HMI56_001399 [Coelomomyces lativittatus]